MILVTLNFLEVLDIVFVIGYCPPPNCSFNNFENFSLNNNIASKLKFTHSIPYHLILFEYLAEFKSKSQWQFNPDGTHFS